MERGRKVEGCEKEMARGGINGRRKDKRVEGERERGGEERRYCWMEKLK